MFPRPRHVLGAALAVACVPAPATAAVAQIEQVNRASGAAGAFSLSKGQIQAKAGPLTNDGRFVAFELRAGDYFYDEPSDIGIATPGDGLFVRDIVANRTARIASGSGSFITALDRSERLISFVTRQSFDRADTNGQPDLYAYERTTGLKVLLSRATGYGGAALGLTSVGTLTRGSRYAFFGTAAGVMKRDVLRGTTAPIATSGQFLNDIGDEGVFSLPGEGNWADEYASADGRVVVTSEAIIAPGRTTPLPTDEYGGPITPLVSEDGTAAIYQAARPSLSSIKRLDPATGVETSIPAPAAFDGLAGGYLLRLTADGGSALVVTVKAQTYQTDIVRWNFATGTVTFVGEELQPYSRNEKFRLGVIGAFNPVVTVEAAGAGTLPGTVEPPSPNAYVELSDECDYSAPDGPARKLSVVHWQSQSLPQAVSARVRATTPGGALLVDKTVATPTPADDFDPVVIPGAGDPVRIDVTVTLADGRTMTERTSRPATDGPAC